LPEGVRAQELRPTHWVY